MSITASIPTIQRPEASTTRPNYVHSIDGVVERIAVAMLTWTRAREARAAISHTEYAHQRQLNSLARQRELGALRLTQRLGL